MPIQSSSPLHIACSRPARTSPAAVDASYQHAGYEHQLEIKKEILRESLRRTAKLELPFDIEVHPSPPWNYRNRSRLQVRVAPSFAAGIF